MKSKQDNSKKKSRIFFQIIMESENVKITCIHFAQAITLGIHRLLMPHVNANTTTYLISLTRISLLELGGCSNVSNVASSTTLEEEGGVHSQIRYIKLQYSQGYNKDRTTNFLQHYQSLIIWRIFTNYLSLFPSGKTNTLKLT